MNYIITLVCWLTRQLAINCLHRVKPFPNGSPLLYTQVKTGSTYNHYNKCNLRHEGRLPDYVITCDQNFKVLCYQRISTTARISIAKQYWSFLSCLFCVWQKQNLQTDAIFNYNNRPVLKILSACNFGINWKLPDLEKLAFYSEILKPFQLYQNNNFCDTKCNINSQWIIGSFV